MKLKVFSVLSVFVLCCTLLAFTSNSSAEPQNQDKDISLIKKIDEIINVLKTNLWWDDAEKAQLTGFFQKYKSNNEKKFKFKKPDSGEEKQEELIDPAAIADYLWPVRKDIKNIKRTKLEFEDLDVEVEGPDYEIDATATVTIKFAGSDFGEVTFTLRHMRRCEWD